jgi:drug/metabolite transporter (DMT)-like permease
MLGESIPAAGVIGVLLAVAGSYELARSVDHGALTAAYSRLFTDRGVQYMTATAVIWSITSNLDKMGVSASSPIVWSASTCSVMSISGIFLLVITRRNATPAQAWKSILPGVSNTGMMAFQMWAITVYPVPYVIAIKRLSTLFTVLAAKLFFGERIAERILGTLITLMGVLIIAWQFSAEH